MMSSLFGGFDQRIWIRFWGMTLLNVGTFMIRPFLALYLSNGLGAGLGIIGFVLIVRPVGSFFGNLLGGYYADKIGRKPVMIAGLLLDAVSLGGYAMTDSVLWFALLSFVQGFGSSFAEPAVNAMVADVTTEQDRTRAFSLMYMGNNVGCAVGPLLGVSLLLAHPTMLFGIMAAATAAFAAVVGLFIPESKPENIECVSDACKKSQSKIGYGFILQDLKLILFLLGSFVITLGYNQMSSYLPLHLENILPEAAWLYGVMQSLNGILCVVLSMPAARFLSRCNPYHVMNAGGVVYTIGMLILAVNHSAWWMLIGFTVFTLGEIISASVSKKLLADFAPDDMRARYMGASGFSWIAGATIGPLLGGQLMQHFGGQAMLLVFTVVMAVSFPIYRLLWLKRRAELQDPGAAGAKNNLPLTH
ncbi:MDR family MFS transporter [Tumebacillus flagellatus]|uniref:Major facilitator superfamily (MFS) profile domain-containing protein n=1 Tax=Tumebacillus flagellatus TaxID=1157490 RepID=A0A074LUP6_9BACL|nr:MFS transporter [Tumebacillus flagellatus]KEO83623.1 hypothetical protein EL26_09430 [Tumebacillus flagellatus]